MSIAIALAVCVFVLVCILIYNSQSSMLLSQLEEAISLAEEQNTAKVTDENQNVPLELPGIYYICAFVDKDGKITKTTNLMETVNKAYVKVIVYEATISGGDYGRVNDGALMFLKKENANGFIFAFTSTDVMDDTISYTALITLISLTVSIKDSANKGIGVTLVQIV